MRGDPLAGLVIEARAVPSTVRIALRGELDLLNLAATADVLDRVCDEGGGPVEIDLSQLSFLGVAAVAMIDSLRRRLAMVGRPVSILATSRAAARSLTLAAAVEGCGAMARPVSIVGQAV